MIALLPGAAGYIATITLATFLHGYGGFGFGYVSVAIFALLGLPTATGVNLLTLASFPIAILLALLDQRHNRIDWKLVGLLGIGIVLATPLGYWFVTTYGQTTLFRGAFGGLLLLFAIYNQFISHRSYRIPVAWGPLFGLLGGFLGGAIVSGGPPMVVYAYGQGGDPRAKKGTLQLSFLVASVVRTVMIGVTPGAFTREIGGTALLLALPAVGALWLGHRLASRSSVAAFKTVVNLLLLAFGVYLIVYALVA